MNADDALPTGLAHVELHRDVMGDDPQTGKRSQAIGPLNSLRFVPHLE